MNRAPDQPASTGIDVLDGMLGGGLPRNRATLITGGPGTGKSTLGMQFLQAGLEAGEECLYVSTEQTIDELRDAFSGFDFDLDHERLSYATIHARRGKTIEEADTFTLHTQEENEWLHRGFDAPFTGNYIEDHLRNYGPCDRVVFDSTSGLAVITEDIDRYRRLVFDLIRFFTDEMESTTMFTAEDYPGDKRGDVLQFTAHGVIQLETAAIEDNPRRFLSVPKMRGVDHDRRRVELTVRNDRLSASPRERNHLTTLPNDQLFSTGIDGIDRLAGGGFVRGAGVLVSHDSSTTLGELVGSLLSTAVDEGLGVALVPTLQLQERRVETLLERFDRSLARLLADDRLFVIDQIGGWDRSQPNVFEGATTVAEACDRFETVEERADGEWITIEGATAMAHSLGAAEARELRYEEELRFLTDSELLVHVLNPAVVSESVGAFYHDAAEQVLELSQHDEGRQYLTLRKSPSGNVGSTALLNPVEEKPYLRVEMPAGSQLSDRSI
ncbi:MAG: ATPase domain-containing protein [Halohasta sp.]